MLRGVTCYPDLLLPTFYLWSYETFIPTTGFDSSSVAVNGIVKFIFFVFTVTFVEANFCLGFKKKNIARFNVIKTLSGGLRG